jgi:hypothetical protein
MIVNFVRRVFGLSPDNMRRPAKKHWREEYDDAAEADRLRLDKIPVEQLLNSVRSGQYGNYYGIWYSIAERASVETAGWILFDTLNAQIDYLYRYHCAAALLALLKISHIQPVQLSGENHHPEVNIEAVRVLLEQAVGRHP